MATAGERTPQQWAAWSGGYEELVEAARALLRLTHDPTAAPGGEREAYARVQQFNERLVRMYVAEGIVTPGTRRGREVEFGFEQLLQLVTARHLMAVEGWKLGQIATFMQGADVAAMQSLLPSRLVEELFGPPPAADEPVASVRESPASLSLARSAPAQRGLDMLLGSAQQRSEFRRQVQDLHTPSTVVDGEHWLRFRLTPWTEVSVQEVALEAWDDELVDALAEKLKTLLRAEIRSRRKGRRR